MTYFSNFRPKLEYASVLWTSVTFTDGKKLESFEATFVAVCYHSFFFPFSSGYSYVNAFQLLNLCTLRERKHQLGAVFIINVFLARSQRCEERQLASSCLFFRMEKFGSLWTDFHINLYFRIFRKVNKITF